MAQQNLQQKLDQISTQIQEAQEVFQQAQGSDTQFMQQSQQQLDQVEQALQHVQQEAGTEATENPQFQQAYEQLHDTRQHVQEVQSHLKDDALGMKGKSY